MAGTIRTSRHGRMPHLTLNSDGRPHPALNATAVFVLVIGLVSFGLGIAIRNVSHPGAAWAIPTGVTGLLSVVVGFYAQMISATREQRVLIVTGIIAGFVGLAMGLANGAFGG